MYRFATGILFALVAAQGAAAQDSPVDRGRSVVSRLCSQCHAIGAADRSPHPTAPAFRRLEPRVDLDELGQRLRDGILAGHPEMPVFVLKANEASAVVTYLRSIQAGN